MYAIRSYYVTESINGISSISEGNLDNVRTISAAAEEQLASIQEVRNNFV